MNLSMDYLVAAGKAKVVSFVKPEVTLMNGAYYAINFQEDISEILIKATGGFQGKYVFGVSAGKGYHSVSIALDFTDSNNPIFYWMDAGGVYEVSSEQMTSLFLGYVNDAISSYDRKNNIDSSNKNHVEKITTDIYQLK